MVCFGYVGTNWGERYTSRWKINYKEWVVNKSKIITDNIVKEILRIRHYRKYKFCTVTFYEDNNNEWYNTK